MLRRSFRAPFRALEIDGGLFRAQRYAIDFRRLDDQLNTFAGDSTRNESYTLNRRPDPPSRLFRRHCREVLTH